MTTAAFPFPCTIPEDGNQDRDGGDDTDLEQFQDAFDTPQTLVSKDSVLFGFLVKYSEVQPLKRNSAKSSLLFIFFVLKDKNLKF